MPSVFVACWFLTFFEILFVFVYFYFVCMSVFPACMPVRHVHAGCLHRSSDSEAVRFRGHQIQRPSDLLELELQTLVN